MKIKKALEPDDSSALVMRLDNAYFMNLCVPSLPTTT